MESAEVRKQMNTWGDDSPDSFARAFMAAVGKSILERESFYEN